MAFAVLSMTGCPNGTEPGEGDTLEASFSGPFVETNNYTSLQGGGSFVCVVTYDVTGDVTVAFEEAGDPKVGEIDIEWSESVRSRVGSCGGEREGAPFQMQGELTGTAGDFHFTQTHESGTNFQVDLRLDVTGSKTDQGATVTITLTRTGTGQNTQGTTSMQSNGSATWTLTLR